MEKVNDEIIIAKYRELVSAPKVSNELGIKTNKVYEVLKRHNIKTCHGLRFSDEEIIAKYKELGFAKQVAKEMGIQEATIRRRLKKNGINVKQEYKENVDKISLARLKNFSAIDYNSIKEIEVNNKIVEFIKVTCSICKIDRWLTSDNLKDTIACSPQWNGDCAKCKASLRTRMPSENFVGEIINNHKVISYCGGVKPQSVARVCLVDVSRPISFLN